jgi:hypothetical protein
MGELVLRGGIALSVAAYAAAEWRRFRHGPDEVARGLWTAAALLCLAHVGAAFHVRHGWSHDAAYHDTARQLAAAIGWNSGTGLYVNYGFLVVWTADVLWWWIAPAGYRRRPPWVTTLLAAFFLFMFINAAVLFAGGPMRLAGAAAVLLVAWAWYAGRADD